MIHTVCTPRIQQKYAGVMHLRSTDSTKFAKLYSTVLGEIAQVPTTWVRDRSSKVVELEVQIFRKMLKKNAYNIVPKNNVSNTNCTFITTAPLVCGSLPVDFIV